MFQTVLEEKPIEHLRNGIYDDEWTPCCDLITNFLQSRRNRASRRAYKGDLQDFFAGSSSPGELKAFLELDPALELDSALELDPAQLEQNNAIVAIDNSSGEKRKIGKFDGTEHPELVFLMR